MMATSEAKVPDRTLGPLLASNAALSAKAEHALDVDLHVRRRPLNECKRGYLARFGRTARQFNAVVSVPVPCPTPSHWYGGGQPEDGRERAGGRLD